MCVCVRKILVSIKCFARNSGPEMAVPILWAPGKIAFFLQENRHAHKIPLFLVGYFVFLFLFYLSLSLYSLLFSFSFSISLLYLSFLFFRLFSLSLYFLSLSLSLSFCCFLCVPYFVCIFLISLFSLGGGGASADFIFMGASIF